MLKENKRLVKVIANSIEGAGFGGHGSLQTSTARGIQPLKRGETLLEFIAEFLKGRDITEYTVNERNDGYWTTTPIMHLTETASSVITFYFLEFMSAELGYRIKDLTPVELERDMKQLKKALT